MWKTIELTLIWAVAILLAVPEAVAFDLVTLEFKDQTIQICMLPNEQASNFMTVNRPKNVGPF